MLATLLSIPKRPLLMGILNVTPDSFSDGGKFNVLESALNQARDMQKQGADILDIGGESTRPDAAPISAEEEIARVIPVLARLREATTLPISIDTYKAKTARAALENGASIVNDVWGLQHDDEMAQVVAEAEAGVIIMHNRAEIDPRLDMIKEMQRFFEISLERAAKAGILPQNIALDPGIGFGKSLPQNIEALQRLPEIKAMGFPVLVGASRKSLIGKLLDQPVEKRLTGTLMTHLFASLHGADILRVHDVEEHRDALRMWEVMHETALHRLLY